MPLVPLLDAPELLLATSPGLLLATWRTAPTPLVMRKISDAMHGASRAGQLPAHLLVIVGAAPVMPDGPTRAALSQCLRETEKYYTSVTIALLSQGFLAASIRAMLTGLQLLVKPPYPVKIFGTLPEASRHLEAQARGFDTGLVLEAARQFVS